MPGQGGPVPLIQAPTLTKVFFTQEPEARRRHDDSDRVETEMEAQKQRQRDRERH